MVSLVTVVIASCVVGAANNESTNVSSGWVCLAQEAAFSPRDTAEGFIFDGKLWLSNGYYHGNVLSRDLSGCPPTV